MGLINLFSKKTVNEELKPQLITENNDEEMTIEKLCELLNSDTKINLLKILNMPLEGFIKATQAQIDANPDDKKGGVVEVYIAKKIRLFNLFDHCIIKIYKEGNKQFLFYTTTSDAKQVSSFANTLYNKLGDGLFYEEKYNSFRDFDKIENIANGFCTSERDDCDTIWTLENNFSIWLNYHVNPLKQFVFQILEK